MNEREQWLSELQKSFRLDSQAELRQKFLILKHEGLEFNSLDEREISYGLESFPDKTELVRFYSHSIVSDKQAEVLDFYSEQAQYGEKIIITSKEQELWSDQGLIDVYAYLESINFDLEDTQFQKLIKQYQPLINLSWVHNAGGNALQELAFCLKILSTLEIQGDYKVLVSHDSQLFYQISKLRALRHILESLKTQKNLAAFEIVSECSKSFYSNYEESTNMLRNMASTTAAMMGGADFVVIDNYFHGDQELYDRQTRNTYHVLNEESQLLGVKDPAKGSRLIESLTGYLVEEGFKAFVGLESLSLEESIKKIAQDSEKLFVKKQNLVESQRKVLVGVNNYANAQETRERFQLFSETKLFPVRRPHGRLEGLRKKLENKDFKVVIASFGELRKSFARVNFAQNIFEVLGKEVILYHSEDIKYESRGEDVIVICAADEDYQVQLDQLNLPQDKPIFLASKEVEIEGYRNLHRGSNLYELFCEIFKAEEIS